MIARPARCVAWGPVHALLVAVLLFAMSAIAGAASTTAAPTSASCSASDSVGKRWPLLFIHGYTSHPSAWSGAVKRFCSTDVYAATFDYSQVNTNWVTDPQIGHALATRILALANASHRGGGPGKVLLVGHSLGGLAIRCAADGRCNGGIAAPAGQASPVATAIAGITTFGTPNLGTILKSGGKSLVSDTLGPLLSAVCYGAQGSNFGVNDLLNGMCAQWRGYTTSAAGAAFTPGSQQLNELPDQPAGVPVLAVAGKGVLGVRMFWNTIELYDKGTFDTGDFVVSRASAEEQNRPIGGFGGVAEVNCGSATISITGFDTKQMKCWHGAETSNSQFLDKVQLMVDHFVTRPVTDADLLSAPVPALRGNPAGPLVNGRLNGGGGGSTLLKLTGGAAPAHGDFTGDGVPDAAAVIGSTSGAGGQDQYVELYTDGDHLLGGFDPTSVDPHGVHAYVMAMIVRDKSVLLDWSTDHGAAGRRAFWSGRLTWDSGKVVLSELAQHTGITGSGLWSDQALTISPQGLGAVHIGMTRAQAQDAEGLYFDGFGDGAYYPTELPPGYPHDYVDAGSGMVICVGAQGDGSSAQQVSTLQGVRLGDTVAKMKDVFGSSATYVPAPQGGQAPRDGYVVSSRAGTTVFTPDPAGRTIVGITAGGANLTPSSCTG